jgi:hypothetical protein
MARIENKIRENREFFDVNEPSQDHFERFSRKLAAFNRPSRSLWNRGMLFKAVAAFIVLLLVSFLVTQFYSVRKESAYAANAEQLPAEVMEAENYYNRLNDEKFAKIDQLADSPEEASRIKDMAKNQMEDITASNTELQKEYSGGVRNQRVLDALVNNYRIMANLLDRIIDELNQENTQNTEHHENNGNDKI